ncbi:triose-phosphate transporter family-domain-containing protein [Lactifluus volemus]|nr:triose-phosphate transporter family-domain-containing protein [Lactifluus volemus]
MVGANTVATSDASRPFDALPDTLSRPKATVVLPLQKAHDLLPLPALSSSRSRLYSTLALAVLEELRHLSALTFRSACAWISGVSDYRAFWLVSYFVLNLALTLYNKVLLASFPYPYTLTATHALFGLVGGTCLRLRAVYQQKSLWGSDYVLLVAFSVLYSINIAISNASLDLVTVPFHQIVRAAAPFFTTILSWHFYNARFNRHQISSITLVIFGVGLATYGDYYFTTWGFSLTLAGTFLAALKTMATHEIQTAAPVAMPDKALSKLYRIRMPFGSMSISFSFLPRFRRHHLQLHPLDLLTRLSRLAVVQCIVYAYLFGEVDLVLRSSSRSHTLRQIILISGNGVIACALNIVSFEANRRSGALSMGVAANVKQVLTVLCSVWFFRLTLTPANALGIALTLLGGGWYTIVEYHTNY